MLKNKISTLEELKVYLKANVSEKRYLHSLSVAQSASMVLSHYDKKIQSYNGFDAPLFCGLAHDIAREMSASAILDYCKENHISLPKEDIESPILAHGLVSAEITRTLVGPYPLSWYKALCVHTTGNTDMDDLALALFIADFIEPRRDFLTEQKRKFYLSSKTIYLCAYRILCDMIKHGQEKAKYSISKCSLAMKKQLEECGCKYEG